MTCPRSHVQNIHLNFPVKPVCLTIMLIVKYKQLLEFFPQKGSAPSRYIVNTDCVEGCFDSFKMLHVSLSLFCTPARQHLGPLCVLWVMVCCRSIVAKYFGGNSRQRKVPCSNIRQSDFEKSWIPWKTVRNPFLCSMTLQIQFLKIQI